MDTTTKHRHDSPSAEVSPAWHALAGEEAVRRLESDAALGLSHGQAATRALLCGANVLEVTGRTPWWTVLARQFANMLIVILLAAAAVSLAVGKGGDALTILAIVVLNGGFGFLQEWRAEKALEALRHMLSPMATVIRDGAEQEIESAALVPGDMVLLAIGDRVPADLRLLKALDLKLDESALTGESASVAKEPAPVAADAPLAERRSMAWMGTAVTNGRALGVVAATGMATEFGRIARLTQAVRRHTTPLQEKLGLLGRQLGLAAVGVSALVALTGWLLGKPLLDMFMTGVSLAVAVVPEGLPAVVTITLALGIQAMVRRNALLRRLQAAETLGAASVICTDKTGTLTRNEMTVTRIWLPSAWVEVTGTGYDPAGHFEIGGRKIDYRHHEDLLSLLRTGMICNHAHLTRDGCDWQPRGEPTEAALVVAAYKAWLPVDHGASVVGELSFNSTRKRMSVVTREAGGLAVHVKGAPEVILERCTRICDGAAGRPLTEEDRVRVLAAYDAMARNGLRVLALARRSLPVGAGLAEDTVEQGLSLLGLVGMIDPPRPEAPEAIRIARRAGIRILMITGDAAPTALAIARLVGLKARRAVSGGEIDNLNDTALSTLLRQGAVLARTTPEHKMRVIGLLQKREHVVAMTGDGVNDAPALKKADIGVAMGRRGTDVAKGAADMILIDDNFASIIDAVAEGRRQYANIRKFVRYLLSSNTGEVIAIFLNILMGGPLILLPVQILWMNLVTDGVTALALGLEPGGRHIMYDPPRPANEPLLGRAGGLMVAVLGLYIGVTTLVLFHVFLGGGTAQEAAYAQTVAFTAIIVLEKVNVLNFRTLKEPMSMVGWFSNPWLLIAAAGMILLQAAAVYLPGLQDALHTVPLRWQDWIVIFAAAAPLFILTELVKRVRPGKSAVRRRRAVSQRLRSN